MSNCGKYFKSDKVRINQDVQRNGRTNIELAMR